jgi:hypothetical protein
MISSEHIHTADSRYVRSHPGEPDAVLLLVL